MQVEQKLANLFIGKSNLLSFKMYPRRHAEYIPLNFPCILFVPLSKIALLSASYLFSDIVATFPITELFYDMNHLLSIHSNQI